MYRKCRLLRPIAHLCSSPLDSALKFQPVLIIYLNTISHSKRYRNVNTTRYRMLTNSERIKCYCMLLDGTRSVHQITSPTKALAFRPPLRIYSLLAECSLGNEKRTRSCFPSHCSPEMNNVFIIRQLVNEAFRMLQTVTTRVIHSENSPFW